MTNDFNDTDNSSDKKEEKNSVIYHFVIGNHLFQKIKKHVRLLKYLHNEGQTKKKWVADAIEQKLKSEESLAPDDLAEERFLSTTVRSDLDKRVEKRVAIYKKLRKSYSKKQWVVEAVYDKLDADEPIIKEKIKELVSTESEDV